MAIGEFGGSINNPKRTLIVNYPIERVKHALRLCYIYFTDINKDRCKYDDILNIYTLHCAERLSFGANMIVIIEELDPNKTKLEFEMQRCSGSYDSSIEIQNANQQMNYLCDALSKILSMSDEELESLTNGKTVVHDSEKKTAQTSWGCLIIVFLLLAILAWALV